MTNLNEYLQDGAGHQSRSVLMFLQLWSECGEIDEEKGIISVARWENCREQGYVVSLNNKVNIQLNIAFFEHRNSDEICAVKWEQKSLNSLTIDTSKFTDVYKDKFDVSHSVGYGEIVKMCEWINEQFENHWNKEKN